MHLFARQCLAPQNVVQGPAALVPSGNLLEIKNLSFVSNLMNHDLHFDKILQSFVCTLFGNNNLESTNLMYINKDFSRE